VLFYSSTNLDSWQLNQLRTMKVGGNASATDFFSKHGGSSLLDDSDTKKKYSGKIAELYKEELSRRVKEDVVRWELIDSSTFSRSTENGIAFPTESLLKVWNQLLL